MEITTNGARAVERPGPLSDPALFPTPEATDEREDIQEMAAATEALLFVSPEPLAAADLRRLLAIRQPTLDRVLDHLARSLSASKRGLRLQRHDGSLRLVTAPEMSLYVDRLRGHQAGQRLSDAALETLALIAYRQPITRPQIEAIRGVDCSGVTQTLLQRGLIVEVGRLDTVGHPILYGTTLAFLQHFGLESVEHLPPVDLMLKAPSLPNGNGAHPPNGNGAHPPDGAEPTPSGQGN
jgi:segregation and condensation protein B